MFQVLTQKGWVDVMHYTMLHSIQDVAPFVAIYFIVYHLAINLVCELEKIFSYYCCFYVLCLVCLSRRFCYYSRVVYLEYHEIYGLISSVFLFD